MPAASREKVKELATRLKKSERAIWYWVSQGCDITSEESIRQFEEGKRLCRTNVQRSYERLEAAVDRTATGRARRGAKSSFLIGNGDLPPAGRRGAAAALERLEETEERAHARLLLAMEEGNPFQVQELQDFWLKCSETLRKLDLAIEMARRDAEEQVPKRLAEELALYIAEWLRVAFAQFLSSEGTTLMGIRDAGQWKAYAVERFRGILEMTVKGSLKTRSPIPEWAASKIKEAWKRA